MVQFPFAPAESHVQNRSRFTLARGPARRSGVVITTKCNRPAVLARQPRQEKSDPFVFRGDVLVSVVRQ